MTTPTKLGMAGESDCCRLSMGGTYPSSVVMIDGGGQSAPL